MIERRRYILSAASGLATTTLPWRLIGAEPAAGAAAEKPTTRSVVQAVLENIRKNGFNPDPHINQGLGGLWINWRTGSDPFQANLSTSGEAFTKNKDDGSMRHDELTDLRYLHNLWLYRTLYQDGLGVNDEIERFTKIAKFEFASGRNERGWMYDLAIDLYHVSQDKFFENLARSLATYFADEVYKPQVGSVCKIKKERPRGSYRVDHALGIGCALVQAGAVFDKQEWREKGRQIIDFVYQHAWLPDYRTFPSELDQILTEDGKANANQRFFREGDTEGGSVKPPALGLMALAMLHTFIVTQDESYLKRGVEILLPLTAQENSLGLWDTENGGYFDKAVFSGKYVREPGTTTIRKGDKEGSRQLHLLQAFTVANRLTAGRFQDMQDALLKIALEKAYYPAGRGYIYAMAADWTLLPAKRGGNRDWVTTEAMGIALEALFSVERKDIW